MSLKKLCDPQVVKPFFDIKLKVLKKAIGKSGYHMYIKTCGLATLMLTMATETVTPMN